MTKRIFRTIFIVAVGVFLASIVLFMTVLYDNFSAVGQSQLRAQIDLAAQGVVHEGIAYFDGLESKNYRITWIGTDGSVLYDSISPHFFTMRIGFLTDRLCLLPPNIES